MKKNIVMIAFTVAIILSYTVASASPDNALNSQGKIIFNNNTEDPSDDVIFDAGDFNKLAYICR